MIDAVFHSKKTAIIPYITYADPNPKATYELIKEYAKNGADIIEIGVPFSDPVADGPVIQASHQRALSLNSIAMKDVFDLVKKVKKEISIPVILMLSVNLVINYKTISFFKDAKKSGLDALVIPDLPIEEQAEFLKESNQTDIPLIQLISPLTPKSRLKKTLKNAKGFVYLMATTGTTGVRDKLDSRLKDCVKTIKEIKDIPVVIGFGISQADHIKKVSGFAEGAIIGSFLVAITTKFTTNTSKMINECGAALKKLSAAK